MDKKIVVLPSIAYYLKLLQQSENVTNQASVLTVTNESLQPDSNKPNIAKKEIIRKVKWTKEEDRILQEFQKQYGNKWTVLSKQLPGRSAIAIKNHFRNLLQHKHSKSISF